MRVGFVKVKKKQSEHPHAIYELVNSKENFNFGILVTVDAFCSHIERETNALTMSIHYVIYEQW